MIAPFQNGQLAGNAGEAMMSFRVLLCLFSLSCSVVTVSFAEESTPPPTGTISYHTQIKPIFQAHCQGCHQPAKPQGGYVMTDFASLLKGGESEEAAVVAGDPVASPLIDQITPVNGEALMPKGEAPLSPEQIELIRTWISQGAIDDTPASAKVIYDAEHPPVYASPPVTTSIDFSPDGTLLAVAGHHEVLLLRTDGSGIAGRLIGVSDRIESVCFSPDGTRLAVTGGAPARMGEVQVWSVVDQTLQLSARFTYDTIYGASWSPDGSRIAFGCTDNSVRVIDAQTGKEVLFMGSHGDWVLDTAFSNDGNHVVSVGRDQTAKLTEFETARFVDNITSITPGALTGGLAAVQTHPERDEILVGGADGVPRTYRMHRLTKRVIGDDANLVREFPATSGRIFDVAYSPDAKQIAVVSSDNGVGHLAIYSYESDGGLTEEMKKILEKRVAQRSAEEKKKVAEMRSAGIAKLAQKTIPGRASYTVAYHPTQPWIAVASTDGKLRLFHSQTAEQIREIDAYPIQTPKQLAEQTSAEWTYGSVTELPESQLDSTTIKAIEVLPAQIVVNHRLDVTQLLVTATLQSGDRIDVTRDALFQIDQHLARVDKYGLLQPVGDGSGMLQVTVGPQRIQVPVTISGQAESMKVDYVRDVTPVLSKLGCNQGTCHGSANGKAGFKLSLRGYDPLFDVRALTDDHNSRRANTAAPDESLMLLKAIGGVPHVGGQLTTSDHKHYKLLRAWIADGAKLDRQAPKVQSINVFPKNPTIQQINSQQQVRVLATYTDGTTRDVTYESFIESGNTEVATINNSGLLTAIRRGEASILARYEGAYAATTLTVMGNREGFVWQDAPTFNHIDELVTAKWKRLKIQPSELCSDAEFIRRVTIDLTGLPPTAEAVQAFMADQRPTQEKRDRYVDYLVGSEEYVTHMTNKWADLLQVNGKFLGREGATLFRNWIQENVQQNKPYDQFVREILTASGSNKANPPAAYYKVLRNPEETMENTTHLFLAIRFNCNKCHDHPFERWTQDQYYETAAYFAQIALKADPAAEGKRLGGTAVESGKPLYEIVSDKADGEMVHQRTSEVAPPAFPYESTHEVPETATRRQQLAAWMTSPDNQYFAKSYVNRLWGYLFGVGIIDPIDDIRAGNPPTNPELLDYLTTEFINSGFDVQHVIRLICKSRTYQLSVATNQWNADDNINFSHALARRLPAETLFDAIHHVTGSTTNIPGVSPGTRAAALADSQIKLPDGFLSNFGRPSRESACECERTNDVQLGPVMALVSGKTVSDAIADPKNALPELVQKNVENSDLINALYLRILNRPATQQEIEVALPLFAAIAQTHQELKGTLDAKELWWKPIREQKEQERLEKIANAEQALEQYRIELQPRLDAAEQQRQQKIAEAQQKLDEYNTALEEPFQQWVASHVEAANIDWQVLTPTSLKSSTGAELKTLEDGSVFATLKPGLGHYEVVAETELSQITAIRFEALTHPELPGQGPGLPPNGNFVLTELEVFATPVDNPEVKPVSIALQNAQADFSQANFEIAKVIDGNKTASNNGWAISPQTGKTHWATFELKTAHMPAGKTKLRFVLHQRYQDQKHQLGRFRISITSAQPSIPLGLPGEIAALIRLPAEQWTPEQKMTLIDFYKRFDQQFQGLVSAVAEAKKPLPKDPGLTQHEQAVEVAKQQVEDDPALIQLRQDFQMSLKLQENERLTAAQDLTWALINSPAFLFNR